MSRFRVTATLFAVALTAVACAALGWRSANAQPQPPANFFGSVSIDGKPVPDGTEVRGLINGKDCTQPSTRPGTLNDGGVSAYAIAVMHESQEPGCGTPGAAVVFTIGGRRANEGVTWKPGPLRIDLNAGTGTPPPLPTPTPTPANATPSAAGSSLVSVTPRPTGSLPTDDVTFVTPKPLGAAAPKGDGGISAGLVLAIVIGALALTGGAIGVALGRRHRPPGDGAP